MSTITISFSLSLSLSLSLSRFGLFDKGSLKAYELSSPSQLIRIPPEETNKEKKRERHGGKIWYFPFQALLA
jgi:hypothetical protein